MAVVVDDKLRAAQTAEIESEIQIEVDIGVDCHFSGTSHFDACRIVGKNISQLTAETRQIFQIKVQVIVALYGLGHAKTQIQHRTCILQFDAFVRVVLNEYVSIPFACGESGSIDQRFGNLRVCRISGERCSGEAS